MAKYKVTYYENFYADVEIEADSPEQAQEIFWKRWGEDEKFVDDVLSSRQVPDSWVEAELA